MPRNEDSGYWLKRFGKAIANVFKRKPKPVPVKPPPPPVITPPPPPVSLGHYRILTDMEQPFKYNEGLSRTSPKHSPSHKWNGNPMTPMTVRLHGLKSQVRLSNDGLLVVNALNYTHNTLQYVDNTHGGWTNGGDFPMVQVLTFGGGWGGWVNLFDVERIEGNKAYVRTWKGELYDPCTVHQWVNVDQNGKLYGAQNPAGDGVCYIVLDYPFECWVELDKLEKV